MVRLNTVIVRALRGRWHAELLTFWMEHDEKGNSYIAKKEKTDIAPKSGWKSFLDTLSRLQILTLPHSEDIPGYNGCGAADGIIYYFEVATVKKYRLFYYCNPDYTLDNFWQAYNVMQFAAFLETNLGLNTPSRQRRM